jgi:FkbM family methyltransferase
MLVKAIRDAIYHRCLASVPDRYKARVLNDLVRMAPETVQRRVFINLAKAIPETVQRRVFIDYLAKAIHVSRATIEGKFGEITGLTRDNTIFPTYVISGVWSKNVSDAFIEFFRDTEGGTYLDIGANIGLTTIPIARNPKIECHAIEPEPANFELLQENISRNGLSKNVQLHNVAVFSDTMELTFELAPDNFGDHRVRIGDPDPTLNVYGEERRRTINVNGDRLDRILNVDRLRRPIAIKIDVEGAEYHLYKGGRAILQAADLVIMEFWPYALNRMGGNTSELLRMIEDDFPYAGFVTGDEPIDVKGVGPFAAIKEELATKAKAAESPGACIDLILTRHCDPTCRSKVNNHE